MYLLVVGLTSLWIHAFCRKKVSGDYEALNERLQTLPDQLTYDIMVSAILVVHHIYHLLVTGAGLMSNLAGADLQYSLLFSDVHVHTLPFFFHPLCRKQVPFGPLAFMPGKLVHTNEITALLGDNWFAKCSAKQAQKIVNHRMKCESPLKKTALSF